jgi:hypothetical protein
VKEYKDFVAVVDECLLEIGNPDNIQFRIAPHEECGLEFGMTCSSVSDGKLSLYVRIDELCSCVSVKAGIPLVTVLRHELRHCKDLQYVFDTHGLYFSCFATRIYSEKEIRIGFRIITEYAAHRVIKHRFTDEDITRLCESNKELDSYTQIVKRLKGHKRDVSNDIVNMCEELMYGLARLAASCDEWNKSICDELACILPKEIQYEKFTILCMKFTETLKRHFDTPFLYSMEMIKKIGRNAFNMVTTYGVRIIEQTDGCYDVEVI